MTIQDLIERLDLDRALAWAEENRPDLIQRLAAAQAAGLAREVAIEAEIFRCWFVSPHFCEEDAGRGSGL